MALWGEYQSIIQLGAALNFGYAAFDLVYRSTCSPVIDAFNHMQNEVSDVLKERTSKHALNSISANRYQALKRSSAIIEKLSGWITASSPFVPILSGFISTIFLLIASEIYSKQLLLVPKIAILVAGYAWITFMGTAIVTAYVLCQSVKK